MLSVFFGLALPFVDTNIHNFVSGIGTHHSHTTFKPVSATSGVLPHELFTLFFDTRSLIGQDLWLAKPWGSICLPSVETNLFFPRQSFSV